MKCCGLCVRLACGGAPAQLAPLPCLSKGGAIAVLQRGANPRLRANTFDRGHGSLDDSFWGPRLGCLRCENHNPVRRGNRIRWGAGKQRRGSPASAPAPDSAD
ncbi:hypothetical protein NDU88_003845 [Pleurodeles waltl]|uniref:Secreted protein n=1 Tax=Pleurodeles waltl TaxID=8319 RepID=A0AAV7L6Z8_PLEWA|nr:hypothetical protein NDU88_003845 [Pleurodeles waltl]